MTAGEMVRLLKKHGCKLIRHGARHDIWMNPETGGMAEIPRHPSKELPTGTANDIKSKLELK